MQMPLATAPNRLHLTWHAPWLGAVSSALVATVLAAGCGADPSTQSNQSTQSVVAGSPPSAVAMTAAGAGSYSAGASAAGRAAPAAGSSAAGSGGAGALGAAGHDSAGAGAAGSGGTGTAGAAGIGAAGAAAAGTGGAAESGSAGLGGAGAGGDSATPMESDDPCGPDAQPIMGTTRAQGYGNTNLQTSGDVEFLSATSTLIVPSKPSPERGTLFLWPGLQPLRQDQTIGYGVLQPVLTWGSSCAPGTLSTADGWWISAQYVGTPPGSFSVNCKGGKVMKVDVGDKLDIEMKLNGTTWVQTVKNQRNGETVDFSIDLKGQKQQWLLHQIEVPTSTKPVDDVIFTSITAKLSASQPNACLPNAKGTNDYYAPPRASADGKTCCISKIILRASGVMPSSPDTP